MIVCLFFVGLFSTDLSAQNCCLPGCCSWIPGCCSEKTECTDTAKANAPATGTGTVAPAACCTAANAGAAPVRKTEQPGRPTVTSVKLVAIRQN